MREAVRRELLPACQLEVNSNLLQMDYMLQDMVVLQWDPPANPQSGFITYWAARQVAERRRPLIAFEMGLEPRRLLDLADVWRLTMQDAAGEYDDSQLDSFRECLMIEVDSPTEGECYVFAEVWGTRATPMSAKLSRTLVWRPASRAGPHIQQSPHSVAPTCPGRTSPPTASTGTGCVGRADTGPARLPAYTYNPNLGSLSLARGCQTS